MSHRTSTQEQYTSTSNLFLKKKKIDYLYVRSNICLIRTAGLLQAGNSLKYKIVQPIKMKSKDNIVCKQTHIMFLIRNKDI